MTKPFVPPNDPVLSRAAEPVAESELGTSGLSQIIDEMYSAGLGEQGDPTRPLLVGLAAPQIGISKRVILVDIAADGKGNVGDLRLYINPKIDWHSSEVAEWYEGCYSTDRVTGIVSRPIRVRVKALTLSGEETLEEYNNYTARIFQHEIDHLDGREFVSHITDDANLHWVEEEQFPEYRNGEQWRNWPIKCPRERWNRIKGTPS